MEKISNFRIQLDDFELSFKEQTHTQSGIYRVSGASGSGKTTLMRSLAGLEPKATFEWTYSPPVEMGFAFQDIRLFGGLTVEENLVSVLGIRIESLIPLLEMFEILDCRKQKARELSGGQAQRVGFIRAIAKESKLVFLDETFGQVERVLREKMYQHLRILKEKGGLVFISSHLSEELGPYLDGEIKL